VSKDGESREKDEKEGVKRVTVAGTSTRKQKEGETRADPRRTGAGKRERDKSKTLAWPLSSGKRRMPWNQDSFNVQVRRLMELNFPSSSRSELNSCLIQLGPEWIQISGRAALPVLSLVQNGSAKITYTDCMAMEVYRRFAKRWLDSFFFRFG